MPSLLLRLTGIDIERCHVCVQDRLGWVEMLRSIRPVRPTLALLSDTS